jgi:proline iminopeptidase
MDRRDFLELGAAALLAAAAPPAFAAPATEKAARLKTGGIELIPVDGKYKVWTKKVGSGKTKMLLLHGGPGCTHEYFECFEDFLPQAGVTFYYYDQLGSAYSDQPDDKSLWTVDRFREEVEQVRKGLGLDDFILCGHSWGGMLGIEYALKYQKHLKALVISNMTASIKSYVAYMDVLRHRLPPEDVKTLEKYEAEGKYEAPEYQAIIYGKLYKEHLCRLDPWPDPVERTFKHLAAPVYNTMQGANEFVVTGTFKDWDRWADLPKIQVPTLLSVGRHDEMKVEDIQRMGKLIPGARVSICENGSHLSMYDDQEAYFRDLVKFVRDVGAGAKKA